MIYLTRLALPKVFILVIITILSSCEKNKDDNSFIGEWSYEVKSTCTDLESGVTDIENHYGTMIFNDDNTGQLEDEFEGEIEVFTFNWQLVGNSNFLMELDSCYYEEGEEIMNWTILTNENKSKVLSHTDTLEQIHYDIVGDSLISDLEQLEFHNILSLSKD